MAEEENKDTTNPDTGSGGDGEEHILRIRGIPWSCSREEIQKFFECSRIRNGLNGIHFSYFRDGRPNGEAFIEFESGDDAEKALQKKMQYIGSRYIEVFTSSRMDMNRCIEKSSAKSSDSPNMASRGPGGFYGGPGGGEPLPDDIFIRVRGLPWSCNVNEIEKFFQGCEIAPNGIKMPVDRNKRSIGEAYLQFATSDDADKAMNKHKEKIGHRYIEVFRSSCREFNRISLDGESHGHPGGPPPFHYGPPPQNYGGPPPMYGRMQGPPGPPMMDYGPPPPNYGGWQEPYRRGPPGPPRQPPPPPHTGYDGGYGGGPNYQDWNKPGPMRGRFPRPHKANPYPDPGQYRNARNGGGRNGGGMGDGIDPNRPPHGLPASYNNNFIFMRGVPFNFVESDIVDFFSDAATPIGVSILFNDYGRPSGEAKVEFASAADVANALKKDRSYLMNNCVELFHCSKDTPNSMYDNNGSHYGGPKVDNPDQQQQHKPPPPSATSNVYGANYSYNITGGGDRSSTYDYSKPNNGGAGGPAAATVANPYNNGNVPQNAAGGSTNYSYYGMKPPGWRNPPNQQQPGPPQPPPPSSQPNYANYSYTNPYLAYSTAAAAAAAAAASGTGGQPPAMYDQSGGGGANVTGYSYSTSNMAHTIKKEPVNYSNC